MAKGTALKVGAVVVGVLLALWLVQTVLGWLFQLAALAVAGLVVLAIAYAVYRIWIGSGGGDGPEPASAGRDATAGTRERNELDAASDARGTDADGLSDEEFERELEKLGEDS